MTVLYGASEGGGDVGEVLGHAYRLFEEGDYIGAYTTFRSIERLVGQNCQIQNDIAVVLFKLGALDLSLARFERAAILDGDSLLSRNLIDALSAQIAENRRLAEDASKHDSALGELRTCKVCGGELHEFVENYRKCTRCQCLLFVGSGDLIVAQNSGANDRNEDANNATRVRRMAARAALGKVVDFGCGGGVFLSSLKRQGIDAVGIDLDTELSLDDLADGSISAFSMIEVIEHLADPLSVMRKIVDKLGDGGVIYLETTFADNCTAFPHPYVSPAIGHVLIHSYGSIALLAECLGMSIEFLNRNVTVLRKEEG